MSLIHKGFVAHIAMVWMFSAVFTQMDIQIALTTIRFVTHTAMVWRPPLRLCRSALRPLF
jgi:hypothetical protein